MENYKDTIISQYANSETINSLISSFNQWIDPRENIDDFYDMMMNLDTAQGYGLDCWGRIVGVQRVLQVATSKYLGFEEATSASADPFNQSPFYTGEPTTSNFYLSDQAFRTLILAKALANITDGSIQSINNILLTLFPGRGLCYVTDNNDMTIQYVFFFYLLPYEQAIVENSGVIPRPSGVSASTVINFTFSSGTAQLDIFYLDLNQLA